jgi:hypothetical protein
LQAADPISATFTAPFCARSDPGEDDIGQVIGFSFASWRTVPLLLKGPDAIAFFIQPGAPAGARWIGATGRHRCVFAKVPLALLPEIRLDEEGGMNAPEADATTPDPEGRRVSAG